jgi:CHASE3 domain sensor protein
MTLIPTGNNDLAYKEIERLKAENAKLKGDVEKMGALLKERLEELNSVIEFNKKGNCEEVLKLQILEANKITDILQAAGITE